MRIGFWWGNRKQRDHYEHLEVGERIKLKCILKKYDVALWTRLIWLRIGTRGEFFIKYCEILD
jgi:hypothetical protein